MYKKFFCGKAYSFNVNNGCTIWLYHMPYVPDIVIKKIMKSITLNLQ